MFLYHWFEQILMSATQTMEDVNTAVLIPLAASTVAVMLATCWMRIDSTACSHCKNRSVAITQVGLSELQLHYQTMCKQVDQLNLLDRYRSQASVNNWTKSCVTGSYYRNATSAAALVNPSIARAVEVLHVQLHFRYPLNCSYMNWFNCLPVCTSEIAKETYSGPAR